MLIWRILGPLPSTNSTNERWLSSALVAVREMGCGFVSGEEKFSGIGMLRIWVERPSGGQGRGVYWDSASVRRRQ